MLPKRFLLTLLVAQGAALSSAGFWDVSTDETKEERKVEEESVPQAPSSNEPLQYGVDIVRITGVLCFTYLARLPSLHFLTSQTVCFIYLSLPNWLIFDLILFTLLNRTISILIVYIVHLLCLLSLSRCITTKCLRITLGYPTT